MEEIGSMVSSLSDVEALPETEEEVVVDQQAKACGAESALAATTATVTGESEAAVLQEQHDDDDKAPEPDHQEVPAPEEHGSKKEQAEVAEPEAAADGQESTRERLKRHRQEMAGRVWVPEMWGQEKLLKDWVDCAIFDRPMVPTGLLTARRALIAECCSRRPNRTPSPASSTSSGPLPVRNGCS